MKIGSSCSASGEVPQGLEKPDSVPDSLRWSAYNGFLSKPHSKCLFQLICFHWFKVFLAKPPRTNSSQFMGQARALGPEAWVKQRLWSHLPGPSKNPGAMSLVKQRLTIWTPSVQKNLAPKKRATDERKTTSEQLRNDLKMSFSHRANEAKMSSK